MLERLGEETTGDPVMTFKSATIYAAASTSILGTLIYLVQVSGAIWIPSIVMQVLVTVCLIPIFTWFVITLPLGRKEARIAGDGTSYGWVKFGTRLSVSAICLPLALVSLPPVVWGNTGVGWLLVPLFFVSCFALATVWFSRIQWDKTSLVATSPVFLSEIPLAWKDLSGVTRYSWLDFTVLRFANGRKARFGRYMEGYEDVMTLVEHHSKHA